MKKDTKHTEGSGPSDSDRTDSYLDEVRLEEELPWHARRTGRRKSRSKGKRRDNSRQSAPGTPGDEVMGDSDLE